MDEQPPPAPGLPWPNQAPPPPWPNQAPPAQWPNQAPPPQWPNQPPPPGAVPAQPYGAPPPPYGAAAPPYGAPAPPYGAAPPPYGPGGGPGPDTTPPAALKPGKGKARGIIILAVICVVVFGSTWYFNRDTAEHAAAGDCMKLDESDQASPFRIVDCSDPSAKFTVLKVISDKKEQCKDVPGASQSSTSDAGVVCLGDKGVDPATAVNVAKEGDCLVINGDDAKRADCSSAAAQDKVLKRLTDVSTVGVDKACDNVPGTTAYYSWTWKSVSGGDTAPDLSVDVLLCLGAK